MANNPTVRVRIPVELERALLDRARHEDRTFADIVRRALRAYVAEAPTSATSPGWSVPDSEAAA